MAKKSRGKKIWHIPKRGNVHQTIFMVHKLSDTDFNNKNWSTQKQEKLASEMGRVGLTSSGKALTHQSVRTLLANIPQYLGFVGKEDNNGSDMLFVTKAGEKLINEFSLENVVRFHNTGRGSGYSIKSYKDAGLEIKESEVFKEQMAKLIITNPNLTSDCTGILLFPFIFTLKVLKEVEYLDLQEIAYILFHAPSDGHLPSTVARIKNFRRIDKKLREYEINSYCKTEEGQLTLVKAPTANYFGLLCESTGLCKRSKIFVTNLDKKISALKIKDMQSVDELLQKYSDVESFDFKNNLPLWYEYFGNPEIELPPFYTEVKIKTASEVLVSISSHNGSNYNDVLNNSNDFKISVPVFSGVEYLVECFDSTTGFKIITQTFTGNRDDQTISLSPVEKFRETESKQNLFELVAELVTKNKYQFDKSYSQKLELILDIFGENYFHNVYKGGRLEYLFFKILKTLEDKGFIKEVIWNGKIGKYGVAVPAPGKASGEPDIVFKTEEKTYVLELTTIGATTMQWSAEGSSVPDHIEKYKERNPNEEVEGIFSAPAIFERNKEHLSRSLEKTNTKISFVDCINFSKRLEEFNSKTELIDYLNKL